MIIGWLPGVLIGHDIAKHRQVPTWFAATAAALLIPFFLSCEDQRGVTVASERFEILLFAHFGSAFDWFGCVFIGGNSRIRRRLSGW